jgi:hypothetical protein
MTPDPPPNHNDYLRAYLASIDAPCPGCWYSLKGLTGTRCPECNQELKLQVGLADPRLAWFVSGVIGIAMGLGFSSMMLAWAGAMILSRGGFGGPRLVELVPLLVGSIVGAALMWGWVRARRRLAGESPERRWTWAAIATVVSLTCPIWFFAAIR